MAVGPTRALLAAYFQASLARSTRELGKQGMWALILLVVFLGLFAAIPVAFGLFVGGIALGRLLGGPESEHAAGGISALLILIAGVGGVMGGLLGGAKKLNWEQYRVFPLSRARLFAAELIAGVGDVLVMAMVFALFAFTAGLAAGNPALIPLLVVVFLSNLGFLLVLQLFLGSLAQRVAKRLKLALGVMLGALWLGSMGMSHMASRKGAEAGPMLKSFFEPALRIFEWLPTTWAAQGLDAWARGQWLAALLSQFYLLAFLGALAYFAARLLEREQEALAPAQERGKARLWSFRHAEEGVARLQVRTLLGSHHGKFGFVMPVMTVVLLRGPMAHFSGQALWALPGAFAYLALFGNQFQFNQFGLDGQGVKSLFLLPLPSRKLLRGKFFGFAVYQGLQVLVLMALIIPIFHPPILELLASLALAACFFLVQSLAGSFTSSWMPRKIDRNSLKNNQMPLPLVLAGLGVSLGCTAFFGGSYALMKWLAPASLFPGMALLAMLCFGAHRLAMPAAAAYLDRRREAIVEAMG